MDTREMATKYRLAHWSRVIRERQESGLSVRAFCQQAGLHENTYYYWQRKLREVACEQMEEIPLPAQRAGVGTLSFTEVHLAALSDHRVLPNMSSASQIHIAIGGIQLSADGGYPSDKLAALLRELARLC